MSLLVHCYSSKYDHEIFWIDHPDFEGDGEVQVVDPLVWEP